MKLAVQDLVKKYDPEYLYLTTSAALGIARDFQVAFYSLPVISSIRELRTDKIGCLDSISGTVTRTSEVRPELVFGTFICEACNTTIRDVEQQFKYTEVSPHLAEGCDIEAR